MPQTLEATKPMSVFIQDPKEARTSSKPRFSWAGSVISSLCRKTGCSSSNSALSRSIKDLGKSSPFRKTERGKLEAKILAKEIKLR